MRSTTVSCWPSLKCLKHGSITSKAASMKFSYLQTTTTSNTSCTQKTWALGKSNRLKNCQDTTSGLIINRAKLMELLMPYFNTPSGMLRKKRSSEPRIQRSCNDCSPCWLKCWNWTWGRCSRCCFPYIKSSSMRQLSYRSCVSSETPFKAN